MFDIKNPFKISQTLLKGLYFCGNITIHALPTHTQKEIKVFSEEEEKTFIEVLKGDRLEVAFNLDLVSGLRSGELLGFFARINTTTGRRFDGIRRDQGDLKALKCAEIQCFGN